MQSLILLAALSTMGAATPIKTARQGGSPNYPTQSTSTGFQFIANVTNPSQDLTPSIQNWVFQGIHVGAGMNTAILVAPSADVLAAAPIFYNNGTAEDVFYGQGTVISDLGTQYPWGLSVQADNLTYTEPADSQGAAAVSVNIGVGTEAAITRFPQPYAMLANGGGNGQFIACNRTAEYYQQSFITVEYAYTTFSDPDGTYDYAENIPAGCAPIALVPQCAVLEDLPEGSVASHAFAPPVGCYNDVATIQWSQYGP